MKLTIASGGNKVQHFIYALVNINPSSPSLGLWTDSHELVVAPSQQVTDSKDLSDIQVFSVTQQLRQAGFVTVAEVVAGQAYPGTFSFS